MKSKTIPLFAALAFVLFPALPSSAKTAVVEIASGDRAGLNDGVLKAPPAAPDAAGRYVFYFHGSGLFNMDEERSLKAKNDFYGVLNALDDDGLTAIGYVRDEDYEKEAAETTVEQIKTLLGAGVPAGNITVAGYSLGAGIVVDVAARLQNPTINYVPVAGCNEFLRPAAKFKGRVLALYNEPDEKQFQSCTDFADKSGGSVYEEYKFTSDWGHSFFRKEPDEWVGMLIDWANGLSVS